MPEARAGWFRLVRLWPIAFIVTLAIITALSPRPTGGPADLPASDHDRADAMRSVIAALAPSSMVLIGMDPDLGTYAEIRPAVRAILSDLLARGMNLSFVSFSPEGRAIAAAELERIRRLAGTGLSTLDLGFVTGAEAAMVRSVTAIIPQGATGAVADLIRSEGGGMAAFDLVVVVGGGDLGARSWVEQVGTRLPDLPMMAVAPTFAEPELQPYLRTGQLRAVLATVRDDAAYVAMSGSAFAGSLMAGDAPPSGMAMLIGLLVALAVFAACSAGGLGGAIRAGLAARTR